MVCDIWYDLWHLLWCVAFVMVCDICYGLLYLFVIFVMVCYICYYLWYLLWFVIFVIWFLRYLWFESDYWMIQKIIFIFFSLSYSNFTIIRSFLPKYRLPPYWPFYPLNSSFFPSFTFTYFILSVLYSSSSKFQYLSFIFQYSGSQKTSFPLPNLPNYSKFQLNNPSYLHSLIPNNKFLYSWFLSQSQLPH